MPYDIIQVAVRSGDLYLYIWPRGQAVKTSPFHGGNTGSIPVGVIGLANAASLMKYDRVNHRQSADYKSAALKIQMPMWLNWQSS